MSWLATIDLPPSGPSAALQTSFALKNDASRNLPSGFLDWLNRGVRHLGYNHAYAMRYGLNAMAWMRWVWSCPEVISLNELLLCMNNDAVMRSLLECVMKSLARRLWDDSATLASPLPLLLIIGWLQTVVLNTVAALFRGFIVVGVKIITKTLLTGAPEVTEDWPLFANRASTNYGRTPNNSRNVWLNCKVDYTKLSFSYLLRWNILGALPSYLSK